MAAMGPLDRLRLDDEGIALEGPIGDDGRPPAGDRVTAQLEHGGIVIDGPSQALQPGEEVVRVGRHDRSPVQLHRADVAGALEGVAAIDDARDWR
jgi:hypothetical protein